MSTNQRPEEEPVSRRKYLEGEMPGRNFGIDAVEYSGENGEENFADMQDSEGVVGGWREIQMWIHDSGAPLKP